jgi:L,D-transpeptidase ErfK/SrfK
MVDNRHIAPDGFTAGIVLNVPQRMLFVFEDSAPIRAFPVAVGRADWRTPLGSFDVAVKELDPVWDVPISIQREMARSGRRVITKVNPGPDNPLGRHWLGLSLPAVGIHGTNQPTSIYRFTTHGCVRLHPDDAADLFDLVDVGTTVDIIYAPVLLAIEGGETFLEVHPDVYGRTGSLTEKVIELLREVGVEWLAEDSSVSRIISERAGRAVQVVPTAADDLVRARRSTRRPPLGDASGEAPGDSGLGGQPSARDVQCRVPATPADPRR